MRTTVTLEDDVALEIAKLQKARDESFKDTLNALLRAGLASLQGKRPRAAAVYRTEAVSLGTPRLKNLDDISEVLAFGEGEDHS
ncbi:MAG: hypothetical protein SF182_28325 [Deltaproteobacteria bacterium]|nr:hypothetical protein [Deltaproteobacteria bacterium]